MSRDLSLKSREYTRTVSGFLSKVFLIIDRLQGYSWTYWGMRFFYLTCEFAGTSIKLGQLYNREFIFIFVYLYFHLSLK